DCQAPDRYFRMEIEEAYRTTQQLRYNRLRLRAASTSDTDNPTAGLVITDEELPAWYMLENTHYVQRSDPDDPEADYDLPEPKFDSNIEEVPVYTGRLRD